MARLFRSNRSQAVRIPKEAEFPPNVEDVDVVVYGNVRVLVPRFAGWTEWFDNGPRVSEDFPTDIPDRPADPVEPLG